MGNTCQSDSRGKQTNFDGTINTQSHWTYLSTSLRALIQQMIVKITKVRGNPGDYSRILSEETSKYLPIVQQLNQTLKNLDINSASIEGRELEHQPAATDRLQLVQQEIYDLDLLLSNMIQNESLSVIQFQAQRFDDFNDKSKRFDEFLTYELGIIEDEIPGFQEPFLAPDLVQQPQQPEEQSIQDSVQDRKPERKVEVVEMIIEEPVKNKPVTRIIDDPELKFLTILKAHFQTFTDRFAEIQRKILLRYSKESASWQESFEKLFRKEIREGPQEESLEKVQRERYVKGKLVYGLGGLKNFRFYKNLLDKLSYSFTPNGELVSKPFDVEELMKEEGLHLNWITWEERKVWKQALSHGMYYLQLKATIEAWVRWYLGDKAWRFDEQELPVKDVRVEEKNVKNSRLLYKSEGRKALDVTASLMNENAQNFRYYCTELKNFRDYGGGLYSRFVGSITGGKYFGTKKAEFNQVSKSGELQSTPLLMLPLDSDLKSEHKYMLRQMFHSFDRTQDIRYQYFMVATRTTAFLYRVDIHALRGAELGSLNIQTCVEKYNIHPSCASRIVNETTMSYIYWDEGDDRLIMELTILDENPIKRIASHQKCVVVIDRDRYTFTLGDELVHRYNICQHWDPTMTSHNIWKRESGSKFFLSNTSNYYFHQYKLLHVNGLCEHFNIKPFVDHNSNGYLETKDTKFEHVKQLLKGKPLEGLLCLYLCLNHKKNRKLILYIVYIDLLNGNHRAFDIEVILELKWPPPVAKIQEVRAVVGFMEKKGVLGSPSLLLLIRYPGHTDDMYVDLDVLVN